MDQVKDKFKGIPWWSSYQGSALFTAKGQVQPKAPWSGQKKKKDFKPTTPWLSAIKFP